MCSKTNRRIGATTISTTIPPPFGILDREHRSQEGYNLERGYGRRDTLNLDGEPKIRETFLADRIFANAVAIYDLQVEILSI